MADRHLCLHIPAHRIALELLHGLCAVGAGHMYGSSQALQGQVDLVCPFSSLCCRLPKRRARPESSSASAEPANSSALKVTIETLINPPMLDRHLVFGPVRKPAMGS